MLGELSLNTLKISNSSVGVEPDIVERYTGNPFMIFLTRAIVDPKKLSGRLCRDLICHKKARAIIA